MGRRKRPARGRVMSGDDAPDAWPAGEGRRSSVSRRVNQWLALIILAAAVSGVIGFILLQVLRSGAQEFAEGEVPRLMMAAELGQVSQRILSLAPSLALSQTHQARRASEAEISSLLDALDGRIVGTSDAVIDQRSRAALRGLHAELTDNLDTLAALIERRINLSESLIENHQDRVLSRRRLAGSLSRPAIALSDMLDQLALLRDPVRIERQVWRIHELIAHSTMSREYVDDMLFGPDGGLALPLEIAEVQRGIDQAVDANRLITERLRGEIMALTQSVETYVRGHHAVAEQVATTATWLFALCAGVIAVTSTAVYLSMRHRVVGRLDRLHAAMLDAAAGATPSPAPTDGNDEIADMGRAFNAARQEIERREAARRQVEDRQRLIAEASPFPIIISDLETGRIQYVNEASLRVAGVDTADAVIGRVVADFYADPAKCDAMMANLKTGRPVSGWEVELRTLAGDGIWALMSAVRVVMNDRPAVYVAMDDITRLKRTETELRATHDQLDQRSRDLGQLAARLEQARREADEARIVAEHANRAKSEFLALMSHELRTPLNAILGFSEIIRDQAFGSAAQDRYADYAADINESGAHLLDLINDILDISKIESGHYDLRRVRLDVLKVCGKVLRLATERADPSRVHIQLHVQPDTPPILADKRAVKQILFNLMSNAIKFTPNGGRITMGARPLDAQNVLLFVEDTGCGIPADQIDKVVHPFVQADSSYARTRSGTGLGLSLVASLTDLHGGALTITSTVNVGTRVEVVLPIRPPAAAQRTLQVVR